MSSVLKYFLGTTQELEQDALLDKLVSLNRRSDRGTKHVKDVLLLGQLTDVLDVLLAQTWFLFFSEKTHNTCGNDLSSECAPSHAHVHIGRRAVDTCDLDAITGLDAVNKVVLQNNRHTARQLTWRCIFWHLLNRHDLRVLVQTITILVGERISVFVFDWESLSTIS